jgi:hypothetical protein
MTLILKGILIPMSRRFVCAWFQDMLVNSYLNYMECADPYRMIELPCNSVGVARRN